MDDRLGKFLTPEQRRKREEQNQQAQPSQPPAPVVDELAPPPNPVDPQTQREVYRAFHPWPRKLERLEIRPEEGVFQNPRYFDLKDIVADRREGKRVALVFPAFDVEIEGKNLRQVVYALRESRSFYIEAYDPSFHAPFNDDGKTPFIQTIRIELRVPPEPKKEDKKEGA